MMRKFGRGLVVCLAGAMLGVSGCATKVERMKVEQVKDLSGEWNDTDSQLVSKEMIADVVSRPWIDDHRSATGKRPAVIVGEVRNLSHEHINVNTFVGDMERELLNSGKVDFVASRDERKEIREERKDMDVNAAEATRKAMGQELGADYMLKGQINTIVDSEGKKQVRYYQIDLTLISLSDNRKVWLGQKKIKKYVEKPALRF